MKRIQYVVYLWTVVITQTGFGSGNNLFLERQEGESVQLPCRVDPTSPPPFGVYLRRSWLHSSEVLYKYKNETLSVNDDDYTGRLSASGDPRDHYVNVTISQLRPADTDRYYCEFEVENVGVDKTFRGKTEFFILVRPDGEVDVELIQTCAGGSAVLPCHTPNEEGLAVDGVSLKRQKRGAPVEVVYQSKQHHSLFPAERVQLSWEPGPHGTTHNVTLLELQAEDSALYSCQLLLRNRPDRSTSLGRRVFFVSVQGDRCGCSSYSTLVYALSAAAGVLLLLLVGLALMSKGKGRRGAKPQPPPPIYEEMVGVQAPSQKLVSRHPEEVESSEHKNWPARKPAPENHYESPRAALPQTDGQK